MTVRVCACGKEFTPKRYNQIHCHHKCNNPKNHNSKKHSDAQRDAKYRFFYGISLEDYNKLFAEQNGCCKICKTHQNEFKKKLHVDHNHKTGEVRGLLCHNCNLAIGRLKEDPAIVKSVLEYLS